MARRRRSQRVDLTGWEFGTFKMLMDERAQHSAEIRASDRRFDDERDRRYFEVNVEREKALKIKETADLAALGLAREIQDYKDKQANELRSQIESERGDYVTRSELLSATDKIEAQLKPVGDYVTGATRGGIAVQAGRSNQMTVIGLVVAGTAVLVSLIYLIVFISTR